MSQKSIPEIFSVDGIVYGYYYNPSKKNKQIELEGTLKAVDIFIYQGNKKIEEAKSNLFGEFKLNLKIGKVYRIELLKTNYTKTVLLIDLESIPVDITKAGIEFHGLELILNSYVAKDTAVNNLPFAKLYYNHRKREIDFEANKPAVKKGIFNKKTEEVSTPIDLLKKSVNKNKDNLKSITEKNSIDLNASAVKKKKKGSIYMPPSYNDTGGYIGDDKKVYIPKKYISYSSENYDNLSETELEQKQKELIGAKLKLQEDKQNAKTVEDSLAIEEAEIILSIRTSELNNALKLIKAQEKELVAQRRILYLVIISSILLLGFLLIVYKFYADKRKTNLLLSEQNKKITDSINYAKRIQDSILLNDKEIKNIISNAFVYFKPRDIVSGDFYWFSEHGNKVIAASVDCTGHGVPGAFLSLIANTLLNEIIYEKNILKPAEILEQLHNGVLKSLHQTQDETKNMDGMELSVCLIDKDKNQIFYAGAMAPIYIVDNNNVNVIEPDIHSIGGVNNLLNRNKKIQFTEKAITINKGMCVYLFTDGYMDQFGGPENKKFNTSNFKKLLLDIKGLPVENQKQIIETQITEWKGESRQIDDMLVIGIKF